MPQKPNDRMSALRDFAALLVVWANVCFSSMLYRRLTKIQMSLWYKGLIINWGSDVAALRRSVF